MERIPQRPTNRHAGKLRQKYIGLMRGTLLSAPRGKEEVI
jgi:hypothetical protein